MEDLARERGKDRRGKVERDLQLRMIVAHLVP